MSNNSAPVENLAVFNSANFHRRTHQDNCSGNVVIVEKSDVFSSPLETDVPANTTITINLLHYISEKHGTFLISLGGSFGTSYRGVIYNNTIVMDTKSTVDPSLGSMSANSSLITVATNDTQQRLLLSLLQFPQ